MCNHSSNHLDNISGIRTRAIEIVSVVEMEFRSEKDIKNCSVKRREQGSNIGV